MKIENNIFFYLCWTNLGVNITNFMLNSSYPIILKEKNINYSNIGIYLSFFSMGQLIGYIWGKTNIIKYGKENVFILSQFLMVIVQLLFGLSTFIDNGIAIGIIVILLRTFQGFTASMLITISYSFISELFLTDEIRIKKLSTLRACSCIGYLLGPLLGSLYIYLVGYNFIFFIDAFLQFFFFIFIIIYFRNHIYKLQNNSNEKIENLVELVDQEIKNYSYLKVFLNIEFSFTFIVILLGVFSYAITIPGNSVHIVESYGISKSISLGILSLFGFSSLLLSIIFSCFTLKLQNVYLIIIGNLCGVIGLAFIGPASFIGNYLFLAIISQCFIGGAYLLSSLKSILEFRKIIKNIHVGIDDKNLNVMSSYMYTILFIICNFFGPIIGGLFDEYLGFQNGMFIFSMFALLVLIFYITIHFLKKLH